MPDLTPVIGGVLTAWVPDVDDQMDLGYTAVRFYVASSENGSYTLVNSASLVAGTKDYSYNLTTASATDWFYWALYGATPGEGPASEPVPIGPPRSTRLDIREAVGARLRMVDVFTLTSVVGGNAAVINDIIDPDASPHRLGNRFSRVVAGTALGQTRRVRSGTTGYDTVNGQITVNRAYSPAWLAADTVELWVADGDSDPSVLIDDAMQRARTKVWWEDTFFFTADPTVSEYVMPSLVREDRVKRVQYAADTYPSRPDWRDVGWWDVTMDGGVPLMTVLTHGLGRGFYAEGTVFRVTYNRPGDRMDDDQDYWECPSLEWAVAETAYEYLKTKIRPRGGKEDTDDAKLALAGMREEVLNHRATWMPSTATRQVAAR